MAIFSPVLILKATGTSPSDDPVTHFYAEVPLVLRSIKPDFYQLFTL